MSTSSQVTLGSLRLQAQQRADLVNNPAVTTPEWNNYISQSRKELFDIMVGAYGNNYHIATPYQFRTNGSGQAYRLPDGSPDFQDITGSTAAQCYKVTGVDLQYSASPNGWLTLRRFEWIERNRFAMPNTQTNWVGYTNLRYAINGNNLYMAPVPQAGQLVQLWYIPTPTSLQFNLPCGTTLFTNVVTTADTTGLAVGMNVYGTGIPTNTQISSVGSTSIVVTNSISATLTSNILSFWNDATMIDGLAGWEEYVVIDAAIKAQIKQEGDYVPLAQQKADMKVRIEAMAEGRDAGQAFHVSDVAGMNGMWGSDDGGWGGGSW